MRRMILGLPLDLVLARVGVVWRQVRAVVESNPPPKQEIIPGPCELSISEGSGSQGPTPPEVIARTKEQMRFYGYHRNATVRVLSISLRLIRL
jgi:hypothetical protein